MGLHSQLNDVSSDSIPLLLLAHIASCFSQIRSSLLFLLHSLGLHLSRIDDPDVDDGLLTSLGSGLAGLIVVAEQLNLNRALSAQLTDGDGGCAAIAGCSDCVVCLCGFGDGDHVRRLPCRHVFHKRCFDGWLGQRRFDCPVCRSKLVTDGRVECTARRVGGELVAWFSQR